MKLPDPEPVASERPSQERRPLSPRADSDALLRRHGFRVHSRPRSGPVLWVRAGVVMREGEGLALCRILEAGGKPLLERVGREALRAKGEG